METLKLSDLICGEIYYSEGYYGPYIFKFNCLNDSGNYIKFTSCIFTKKGNEQLVANYELDSEQHNNLRKATTEEGLWLNTCIKENKYLSKEEALKKTSNYPFEIGKYYQFVANTNSTQIAKCNRLEKGYFESDSWIFCNGIWDKLMSGIWEITLISDIKELSLEEIQQYLPNEHPDKIKYTQLKVGDWVVIINTGFQIGNSLSLSDIVKIKSFNTHGGYDWGVEFTNGCKGGYFKKFPITNYIRRATQEEIDSVSKPKELVEEPICETCNGTGQVMTAKLYPTGHTEVNEDCPDCDGSGFIDTEIKPAVKEYPEYYELIVASSTNFTQGKIYKIIDPVNINKMSNFIDDKNNRNGFARDNFVKFKPSTKEAFDLQESKSKPITNMSNNKYKVGDTVDTNDEGLQFINTDSRDALRHLKSRPLNSKIIVDVKYSEINLNWWYSFKNIGNWHTESSIVGLSKEKIKEISNSSIIEDFQIKCNSEEESKLCKKWAISKGLENQFVFSYTPSGWHYLTVQNNWFSINNEKINNLKEKTLADIGIVNTCVANTPNISNYNCGIDPISSNSVKPESPKYDLSTTITRAINENNPNIIAIESGKSIDEICEGLTDDYCRLSNFRHNTKVTCSDSWCSLCKFHRDNNTLKQTKDWLKGIKLNDTNPTLKNPIVEEFEITPITISKEPDFTTINSIYDRIPDVEY